MQVKNPTLKVIIIGDSMVGKTSLMLRYTDNQFLAESMPTIGLDFKMKELRWKDCDVKLQIWDTAGQDKYRIIAQAYYKGANGVILAYDCTSRKSFDNISSWMNEISQNSDKQPPTVLIATKVDLSDRQEVGSDEGRQKALELGLSFYETSALSGVNIENAIEGLVNEMMSRPSRVIDPNKITIHDPPSPPKKRKCCSSK